MFAVGGEMLIAADRQAPAEGQEVRRPGVINNLAVLGPPGGGQRWGRAPQWPG